MRGRSIRVVITSNHFKGATVLMRDRYDRAVFALVEEAWSRVGRVGGCALQEKDEETAQGNNHILRACEAVEVGGIRLRCLMVED